MNGPLQPSARVTLMRDVLHAAEFQALEAAWRGVDMLIHRIESDDEISLLVLDASLAELQAHLAAQPQAEDCVLFRLLRDRHPGLLVGNFTFGQTAEDLRTPGSPGLKRCFERTSTASMKKRGTRC